MNVSEPTDHTDEASKPPPPEASLATIAAALVAIEKHLAEIEFLLRKQQDT